MKLPDAFGLIREAVYSSHHPANTRQREPLPLPKALPSANRGACGESSDDDVKVQDGDVLGVDHDWWHDELLVGDGDVLVEKDGDGQAEHADEVIREGVALL